MHYNLQSEVTGENKHLVTPCIWEETQVCTLHSGGWQWHSRHSDIEIYTDDSLSLTILI